MLSLPSRMSVGTSALCTCSSTVEGRVAATMHSIQCVAARAVFTLRVAEATVTPRGIVSPSKFSRPIGTLAHLLVVLLISLHASGSGPPLCSKAADSRST
ncbi:hypothetical protein L226DRAFT_183808 [Lentinus tigrinus ALCF2SS1-7]|uniref:uncharacterized protein n=1 Tax=Lentinus tigrinus ALCF2SS1-7 TaxID=1328758 RepID=UPI001165EFD3|nr:hypothetical protein L226DRAFT_183808 [Lentinus tigrinus ALCF2SS1-7]